jgi:hypothetical protein
MKAKPGRKPKKRWWTVLLMRPEYVAEDFTDPSEMFMDHAFAVEPCDAVTIVRSKAVKADTPPECDPADIDPLDYVVLLVTKGRQRDYSIWID